MAKPIKKEDNTCKYPHKKLWCVTVMAIVIILLVWCFSGTWPKVVVTILAALIFIRSIMFNCCKQNL